MVVNMAGTAPGKLQTLVISNIEDESKLKEKLLEISSSGKNYEYDVSSCLKALLKNNDDDIVVLAVQAISELAKCETKRASYAHKDFIEPILALLNQELFFEMIELYKQCCRALGNLCCDCDESRKIFLECDGVTTLHNVLESCIRIVAWPLDEIKLLACKTILNYAIGGVEFSDSLIKHESLIDDLRNILSTEADKEVMDDDMVSTILSIFRVANENNLELLYEENVNLEVFHVLKESSNVEVSELCLEHLHNQAEHDSVKTLLAKEGRVDLVRNRLEQLLSGQEVGDMNKEIDTVMKHACDLITIVLTGDEAMDILYGDGSGEVYQSMVRWLESSNHQLLDTAVMAMGNYARRDQHCTRMMSDGIFDKLLDIFEKYYGYSVSQNEEIPKATINKIQHAALAAIRNLTVPAGNKKIAAERGRAAPLLIGALPHVDDNHVAYKLLAALRMLVDGQEDVARLLASNVPALAGVAGLGRAGDPGAAAESARLLAWTIRLLRGDALLANFLQAEGCVCRLVGMLLASHSLMQNEAILGLTLLAFANQSTPVDDQSGGDAQSEIDFNEQLIKSDIGKHIYALIDTNCAKMPIHVAENLIAFLDITSKSYTIVANYKKCEVHDALKKFLNTRKDLSDNMKACITTLVRIISINNRP